MPLSGFIMDIASEIGQLGINFSEVEREEDFTDAVCRILAERNPGSVWTSGHHHPIFLQIDEADLGGEWTDQFGMKDLSYSIQDGLVEPPSSIIEIKYDRPQTFNLNVQFCHAWNDMIRLALTKLSQDNEVSTYLLAFVSPEIYEREKNGSVNQWTVFFPTAPDEERGDAFNLILNPTNADPSSRLGPATPWPNFITQENITVSHVNYILTGATYTALMGTLVRPSYSICLEIESRAFLIGGADSPRRYYMAAAEITGISVTEGENTYSDLDTVLRYLP